MTGRIVSKVGDVFVAEVNPSRKKYLQYISNDLTQLNSDIVRVFKKEYEIEVNPELFEIINGEVEFYAHCVLKAGIQRDCWQKVGKSTEIGNVAILFRSTKDYGRINGEETVTISENWYVWKTNAERIFVGKLLGAHQEAEIGVVIPPESILHRMRTGSYDFDYPGY